MFATTSPQGVRAQPKSLRPPSTLSSLTTYLNGISSYVSQNLPEKLHWTQHSDNDTDLLSPTHTTNPTEKVLSAEFTWVEWDIPSGRTSGGTRNHLCLFLGYERGFQVWNVSDTDDVREVVSVRDRIGPVRWIQPMPMPWRKDAGKDCLENERPVVAYITDIKIKKDEASSTKQHSVLQLYSLRSLGIAKSIKFNNETAIDAKCTQRVIAVATSTPTIHIYCTRTLHHLASYTDLLPNPLTSSPIFDLGSKYIIYATSSQPPPKTGESESSDDEAGAHQGVARKVAGKVAKELVVGARILGEYGYQALSNYFGKEKEEDVAKMGGNANTASSHCGRVENKVEGAVGVIIIRHLPTNNPTALETAPPISHYKAHRNPIATLTLSPSQTRFLTASTQGNTFYLWSLEVSRLGVPRASRPRNAKCLYKLERGYTFASVESIGFSLDEKFVGVVTGRGTTHVYLLDGSTASRRGALGSLNGMDDGNGFTTPAFGANSNETGIQSLYPVARIKRQSAESPNAKWPHPQHQNTIHAPLLAAFLPSTHRKANTKTNAERHRTGSWPPSSIESPSALSQYLHHQRTLTFCPSDGRLILHQIDITLDDDVSHTGSPVTSPTERNGTASPSTKFSLSPNSNTSKGFLSSSPLTQLKLNGWSPKSLGSHLNLLSHAGKTNINAANGRERVNIHVVDCMEWKVLRAIQWGEVKNIVTDKHPKTTDRNKHAISTSTWPTKLELHTSLPATPLYTSTQFILETYIHQASNENNHASSPDSQTPSDIHPTKPLPIRKELIKPYPSSLTDPSGMYPLLQSCEKVEEDLTGAMSSIIVFDSSEMSNDDSNSVSFADAYHIHIITHQHHSSHSQRDTTSPHCDSQSDSDSESLQSLLFECEEVEMGVEGGVVVHEEEYM